MSKIQMSKIQMSKIQMYVFVKKTQRIKIKHWKWWTRDGLWRNFLYQHLRLGDFICRVHITEISRQNLYDFVNCLLLSRSGVILRITSCKKNLTSDPGPKRRGWRPTCVQANFKFYCTPEDGQVIQLPET